MVKIPEKVFLSNAKHRPRLPYGSALCHMALPYGSAIWLCHMALPYPRFWSKTEKVRSSKKKWDLFQLPNIGLVTHDDLLKISIWPRVEKHVPSTPRGSRYDFYGQLDQNLWPSWWKSGKKREIVSKWVSEKCFLIFEVIPRVSFWF